MTARTIQQLAQRLPKNSPYFQRAFRQESHKLESSSLADRVQVALCDPAFGWNLAESHATASAPLPALDWPEAVPRAHRFLMDPNATDLPVAHAHLLNSAENRAKRDLVRPLLICQDKTVQELADFCGQTLEVLSLFEALFWNCLDRIKDRVYLARICRDGAFGGTTGYGQNTNDHGCNLLRIAYRSGSSELVLSAAGVASRPCTSGQAKERYERIEHRVLASAGAGLRRGSVSKSDNPALEPALKILAVKKILANPEQDAWGIGEALQSSFEEHTSHRNASPQVVYPEKLPPPPPKE